MKRWFSGGSEMDRDINVRFGALVPRAIAGELSGWADTPRGLIALVIVLDQFPRSIYRNTARAYAGDARACELALSALDAGIDQQLSLEEQLFLLMPLVHSEDLQLQTRACQLTKQLAGRAPEALRPVFELSVGQSEKYRGVIERFGRFPHRNPILGRNSTPEELEFAKGWAKFQPPAGAERLFRGSLA